MESSSWNPVQSSAWSRFHWWFVSGGIAIIGVVVIVALVVSSGSTSTPSTSNAASAASGRGAGRATSSGTSGSSTSTTGSSSGSGTTSTDPSILTAGGQTTSAQIGSTQGGTSAAAVGSALAITTTSLPPAENGQPYSATLQVAGASGGVSWSLPTGGLPSGLALSASGVISGTPTTGGSTASAPLFVVTDSQGDTTEAAVPLDVVGGPILYSPNVGLANPPGFAPKASMPTATDVGAPYQATWVISEYSGVPNYTWSIASGSLPPGVGDPHCTDAPQCLDAYTSGTPTAAGTFTFDVRVKDAHGVTGNQTDTIVVNPAPIVTTASLPAAAADNIYTAPVEVSGGTGPYNWSISGPNLANLSISGTSALATISTGGRALSLAPGSYPITVTAQDSEGLTSTVNLALSVGSLPQLVITPTSLPGADEGVAYHTSLNASGGSGSGYTWAATGLPLGVGLAPSGSFSGSPTETGTYPVTITVTDGAGNSVSVTDTLVVSTPPTIYAPSPLTFTAGQAIQPYTLLATGGTPNLISGLPFYTWAATGLPQGLTLDPNSGVLSGTPATPTTTTSTTTTTTPYQVRVTVTDSAGGTQTVLLTLNVNS